MNVAPYAGAWIETVNSKVALKVLLVAPYAGAWIETRESLNYQRPTRSLPTRERGLKPVL